jgi:hypothetical protein
LLASLLAWNRSQDGINVIALQLAQQIRCISVKGKIPGGPTIKDNGPKVLRHQGEGRALFG